jgi:antitoxin (DNA-binding transcriptional repressor) of toxin-antitoxin stability system
LTVNVYTAAWKPRTQPGEENPSAGSYTARQARTQQAKLIRDVRAGKHPLVTFQGNDLMRWVHVGWYDMAQHAMRVVEDLEMMPRLLRFGRPEDLRALGTALGELAGHTPGHPLSGVQAVAVPGEEKLPAGVFTRRQAREQQTRLVSMVKAGEHPLVTYDGDDRMRWVHVDWYADAAHAMRVVEGLEMMSGLLQFGQPEDLRALGAALRELATPSPGRRPSDVRVVVS